VGVLVMVPPGANPHTYEPEPKQLVELSEATLYIKVGSGIEFELSWLDRIASMNREMPVVDASEGISLAAAPSAVQAEAAGAAEGAMGDHAHGDTRNYSAVDSESGMDHAHDPGELDPHIWVSPRNAKIMVENTCRGLIAVDPEHREYYTGRRDRYLEELTALDREIERLFAGKTQREFLVYHPAWGYLARDYGLEQVPVEAEGKEPTARGMKHLIDQARRLGIRTVFVSPQFNTKSAEMIAREIGGKVIHADPLAADYIENIRAVTAALAASME
jgi:zinc transport system substrate-binding protein